MLGCKCSSWDWEKRPGGAPSQKHLMVRKRQKCPFSFPPSSLLLRIVRWDEPFHNNLDYSINESVEIYEKTYFLLCIITVG